MFEGVFQFGWMPVVQFMLVLAAGVLTSFTDLKQGIIRNFHVAVLAVVGGSLSFAQAYFAFALDLWLAGAFMSLIIPLVLWWRSLVSAGDAKLIMAMGITVPSWWYPSFSPVVFPFSIVLFLSLLIPAVSLLIKVVRAKEQNQSQKKKDQLTQDQLQNRLNPPQAGFKRFCSVILPSWIFLLLWYFWIAAFGHGLDGGFMLAAGILVIVLSFFIQEWILRLGVSGWFQVVLLLVVGAACLWLGVDVGVLVFAAFGASLLVRFVGWINDAVADDSSVAFAHSLFLAVILVGAVHLIEIGLGG